MFTEMLNKVARRSLSRSLQWQTPRTSRSLPFLENNPLSCSRCASGSKSVIARLGSRRLSSTTQTPTDRLRDAIKKARREHRILFPTLLIASFASLSYLALLSYDLYTSEPPKIGVFPPAVERHLRNAIWYTEIKEEPSIALDSFAKAIEQAERSGMDPYSPEVTGMHIRLAAALEKFGRARGAVDILERLVGDMIERIEDIDRGRVTPRKVAASESKERATQAGETIPKSKATGESGETERGRLLKQVIECKVKISELYESDYIQDEKSAKRSIDEAMKLLVESMRDPKSLKFDENRAGISADEAGALLSQVADSNITWGKFDTALETYKLALIAVRKSTKGRPSCREASVLANMAYLVGRLLDRPDPVIDGKPVTAASAKQARQIAGGWAKQSLQCVDATEPGDRDQLCVTAYMTGWSALAATLQGLGDLKAARDMYEQVIRESDSQPALKALVPLAHTALKEIAQQERR
jgi:tetratricopeptide (TPR) repeat protein